MTPDLAQPDNSIPKLRVGFLCSRPLDEPNHLSGMPYRMARALRAEGLDIVELCEHPRSTHSAGPLQRLTNRFQTESRRTSTKWRRLVHDAMPGRTREALVNSVRKRSQNIQSQVQKLQAEGIKLDAIFGCCISSVLYELESDLPIIYFSDATSYLICDTYQELWTSGRAYIEAMHHIERVSTSRASIVAYASPSARKSAINDLGVNPDHTHVVPMGAHVTPDDPTSITAPTAPPTRDDCQLLIVAADPVRKRVDLALAATELLRQRGINATLNIVGPGTERSNSSPVAVSLGQLKLSDPQDRNIHQRLLKACHLQLLPSLGEAFGIAPIESAHFARPSIVSGVGGLSFVIQHEQTGIVIDRDAEPAAWTDCIEALIDEPNRYRAMSIAALKRARSELNWDTWGRELNKLIRQAIGHENHR